MNGEPNLPSRRTFLNHGAWTVAAVSLSLGGVSCFSDNPEPLAEISECPTTRDILGPFYRPDPPFRTDLTWPEGKGEVLIVHGNVYGSDCTSVVPQAVVDIWHCNDEGGYDLDTEAFRLRGRQSVSPEGRYEFRTYMPGRYLNGRLYRPAHVHFLVTGPQHRHLISQLYFRGDPHIDDDPWASSKEATHRILDITPNADGEKTVEFDIYLKA